MTELESPHARTKKFMINFHYWDLTWKIPFPRKTSIWVKSVVWREGYEIEEINFIFTTDERLLELNRKHLNHDYFTDVLTFNYTGDDKRIQADIYISLERVQENALKMNTTFNEELHRVMIHGILHLLGYDDHTEEDKSEMRSRENEALLSRPTRQ